MEKWNFGGGILLLFLLVCGPAEVRGQTSGGTGSWVVGTKPAAPFALRTEEGKWTGISIELWRRIAEELELNYEFRETDLDGLLTGLTDGTLNASVAALTVTADREARIDFTHPFYTTGLAIAVPPREGGGWLRVAERFFSLEFLTVIVSLALLLLICGALVWFFERRRNPEQFGGGFLRGVGAGFWWSAVTMTTVGYGDKAPVTPGGRLVALVWMFVAIIIISSFTAAITSSLTVGTLGSRIEGPQDLARVSVATVPRSTSAAYLENRGIAFGSRNSPEEALRALIAGEVEAVVYDAPLLQYLSRSQDWQGRVHILPGTFARQDYAIGLAPESPLREQINRALLENINSRWWRDLLARYLGE